MPLLRVFGLPVLMAPLLFSCSAKPPAKGKVAEPGAHRPAQVNLGTVGTAPVAAPWRTPDLPPGVKDCGRYEEVRHADAELDARNAAVFQCFDEGFRAHSPVAFTLEQITTEGDPIFTYFRATGDGRVVADNDSTHDKFGEKKVTRQECARVERLANKEIESRDCSPPAPK